MWKPGDPVTSETLLEPLLVAIGFGLQDVASYQTIAEKLKTRSVSTVGDLFGSGASWQREEVLACFRTLALKKTPLSYVGAIEQAVQKTMGKELVAEAATAPTKVTTGGNMNAACIKQAPSSTFMPRKFQFDGRVYEGFDARDDAAYMCPEQEKLYLDFLWLAAQANPERSLGDYLPDGMAKQLGKMHDALLPPFKPAHYGKPHERPRPADKVIHLRFQNGRQTYYPRLKLDEKFRDYLGEKALKVMGNNFVPGFDERLLDNRRNDFFGDMIKMHEGSLPVSRHPYNHTPIYHQPTSPPATPLSKRACVRAQKISIKLPGKENGEAQHTPAEKRTPAAPRPASVATVGEVGIGGALDDIDGLELGGGTQLPPPPKQRTPAASAGARGGSMSKKAANAAKRVAGVGKPAGMPPPFYKDSSADEDSSDEDSVAGDGAAGSAKGGPQHTAKKQKCATPAAAKGTLSLSHPTPHSCAHFHH